VGEPRRITCPRCGRNVSITSRGFIRCHRRAGPPPTLLGTKCPAGGFRPEVAVANAMPAEVPRA